MAINNNNAPFPNGFNISLNISLSSIIQNINLGSSISNSVFNTNNTISQLSVYNNASNGSNANNVNIVNFGNANSNNVNIDQGNVINAVSSNSLPVQAQLQASAPSVAATQHQAQKSYAPVVQSNRAPIVNSQTNNFLVVQIAQLLNILNGLRRSSAPRPQQPPPPPPRPPQVRQQQAQIRPPQMQSTQRHSSQNLMNNFQSMFNKMRQEVYNSLLREVYTQLNQNIKQEMQSRARAAAINDFKTLINNINIAINIAKAPSKPPVKNSNNGVSKVSPNSSANSVTKKSAVEVNIGKEGKGEWGDPHYDVVASNGKRIKFDHKGKDNHTYNIFSGDNLQIDGKYVPYKDPKNPQVVGDLNVKAGNDNLGFTNAGEATLNGKPLGKGKHKLQDGTIVDVSAKEMNITTPDSNSKVKVKAEASGITVDPEGKFSNLDGILGKTVLECRALTVDECEKYDVTAQRGIN